MEEKNGSRGNDKMLQDSIRAIKEAAERATENISRILTERLAAATAATYYQGGFSGIQSTTNGHIVPPGYQNFSQFPSSNLSATPSLYSSNVSGTTMTQPSLMNCNQAIFEQNHLTTKRNDVVIGNMHSNGNNEPNLLQDTPIADVNSNINQKKRQCNDISAKKMSEVTNNPALVAALNQKEERAIVHYQYDPRVQQLIQEYAQWSIENPGKHGGLKLLEEEITKICGPNLKLKARLGVWTFRARKKILRERHKAVMISNLPSNRMDPAPFIQKQISTETINETTATKVIELSSNQMDTAPFIQGQVKTETINEPKTTLILAEKIEPKSEHSVDSQNQKISASKPALHITSGTFKKRGKKKKKKNQTMEKLSNPMVDRLINEYALWSIENPKKKGGLQMLRDTVVERCGRMPNLYIHLGNKVFAARKRIMEERMNANEIK